MKLGRTLGHVARRARARAGSGGLVLLYHRVAEVDRDPFRLCVRPEFFAQQLAVIREEANPVSLDALMRQAATGVAPAGSVAVTFDDGYEDNLSAALPLLQSAEVPATVFIVAGYLGREFWWDRYLRLPPARARALPPLETIACLPDAERRRLLGEEASALSAPANHVEPRARALTREELAELAASPLVDVGAHTATHPPLDRVDEPRLHREVVEGKAALEEIVGAPVGAFAYPHGALSRRAVAAVADAGFRWACTTRADAVRAGTRPLRIPRVWVDDADGERLRRVLRAWLGRARR